MPVMETSAEDVWVEIVVPGVEFVCSVDEKSYSAIVRVKWLVTGGHTFEIRGFIEQIRRMALSRAMLAEEVVDLIARYVREYVEKCEVRLEYRELPDVPVTVVKTCG